MTVEPDSGDGPPSETPDEDGSEDSGETDPHLLLYRVLHDEVRSRLSHHYQGLLTGLSVVGVIIAYALLSGELVFLAVVPVVIGFLGVQAIRQHNGVLFIANHLNRIEKEYADENPLFVWERRYGMTGTDRRIERWGIDWSFVPPGIILTFGAMGYIGFIYVAYVVWPPSGVDILAVGLTRNGLLVIYALLTVLVSLAGYSHYLHRVELGSPDE